MRSFASDYFQVVPTAKNSKINKAGLKHAFCKV
jgi:hypothetical protein